MAGVGATEAVGVVGLGEVGVLAGLPFGDRVALGEGVALGNRVGATERGAAGPAVGATGAAGVRGTAVEGSGTVVIVSACGDRGRSGCSTSSTKGSTVCGSTMLPAKLTATSPV